MYIAAQYKGIQKIYIHMWRRSMRRLSRRWSSSWRQTSADSKTTIHIYERDMIIKHASK